jgi:ABC-2 type transport system ATP-binding protein
MEILATQSLTKDFGHGKGAFDVNLKLESGQILGFIGPNGAGKSTTINMISGFILPNKGQISIFGQQVDYSTIHKIYPKIGLLLSEVAFEKQLTPAQIFTQTQTLLDKNLTSKWTELAKYLDLDLHKGFSTLSLGNRKKVGIINSLMHDPELVIMDEPSSGLDPLIQQKLFTLLKNITQAGGAVMLSSHVLSEVQSACDQVMMIKDGHIILQDSTQNILEKALKVFKFRKLDPTILRLLNQQNLVSKLETVAGETLIYTDKHPEILKILIQNNVFDFYLDSPNLENMFLEFYK